MFRGATYAITITGRPLFDPVKFSALRGRRRGGSQPEPAADFFQWDIATLFYVRPIQFGCGLGVDDLLLTKLGKKRNRRPDLSLGKGIHKRAEAVAVGGHAPVIGSRSR